MCAHDWRYKDVHSVWLFRCTFLIKHKCLPWLCPLASLNNNNLCFQSIPLQRKVWWKLDPLHIHQILITLNAMLLMQADTLRQRSEEGLRKISQTKWLVNQFKWIWMEFLHFLIVRFFIIFCIEMWHSFIIFNVIYELFICYSLKLCLQRKMQSK